MVVGITTTMQSMQGGLYTTLCDKAYQIKSNWAEMIFGLSSIKIVFDSPILHLRYFQLTLQEISGLG
jgi:hypothetical protein